jgi:hypothetical protein
MAKLAARPDQRALSSLCHVLGRPRRRAVAISGLALGLASGAALKLLSGPHCWATGPLVVASGVAFVSAFSTLLRASEPWTASDDHRPADVAKILLLTGSQLLFALCGAAAAQLVLDLVDPSTGAVAGSFARMVAACLVSAWLGRILAAQATGHEAVLAGAIDGVGPDDLILVVDLVHDAETASRHAEAGEIVLQVLRRGSGGLERIGDSIVLRRRTMVRPASVRRFVVPREWSGGPSPFGATALMAEASRDWGEVLCEARTPSAVYR